VWRRAKAGRTASRLTRRWRHLANTFEKARSNSKCRRALRYYRLVKSDPETTQTAFAVPTWAVDPFAGTKVLPRLVLSMCSGKVCLA